MSVSFFFWLASGVNGHVNLRSSRFVVSDVIFHQHSGRCVCIANFVWFQHPSSLPIEHIADDCCCHWSANDNGHSWSSVSSRRPALSLSFSLPLFLRVSFVTFIVNTNKHSIVDFANVDDNNDSRDVINDCFFPDWVYCSARLSPCFRGINTYIDNVYFCSFVWTMPIFGHTKRDIEAETERERRDVMINDLLMQRTLWCATTNTQHQEVTWNIEHFGAWKGAVVI